MRKNLYLVLCAIMAISLLYISSQFTVLIISRLDMNGMVKFLMIGVNYAMVIGVIIYGFYALKTYK